MIIHSRLPSKFASQQGEKVPGKRAYPAAASSTQTGWGEPASELLFISVVWWIRGLSPAIPHGHTVHNPGSQVPGQAGINIGVSWLSKDTLGQHRTRKPSMARPPTGHNGISVQLCFCAVFINYTQRREALFQSSGGDLYVTHCPQRKSWLVSKNWPFWFQIFYIYFI